MHSENETSWLLRFSKMHLSIIQVSVAIGETTIGELAL